ncbi:hypothetical protein O181_015499 [Austropuccinia psidii MF-1]|uniref:Integrase catalytic domain-containing protein n=1 Tax=Austropuccinia psidii MF-1 TaxID=1389203 RepID=A0A9Q3C023_9BASI|nr:hypothetical protein [Austropuccinia psidii MF-1]
MYWVTALPSGGETGYNACLVIVDRYRKTQIFLQCYKDDTAMDTALLIWNRLISHTGLFKYIISDKDPKFTLALWTNLHKFLGTKLFFSMAENPQTDCLAERMLLSWGLLGEQEWPGTQESRTHLEVSKM